MLKNIVTFTNANKPQRNVVLLVHDKLNFETNFVFRLMFNEKGTNERQQKQLMKKKTKKLTIKKYFVWCVVRQNKSYDNHHRILSMSSSSNINNVKSKQAIETLICFISFIFFFFSSFCLHFILSLYFVCCCALCSHTEKI